MPIFRVKSVKIYTGQFFLHRHCLWYLWQIWGMSGWQVSDSKEVNFEPPKAILYIYIFRHQQFQVIVQWDRYVWSRNGVLDFLLGCRKCYHINRLHWSTGLDLKRVGVVVKIKPKPKSNEPNIACKIER